MKLFRALTEFRPGKTQRRRMGEFECPGCRVIFIRAIHHTVGTRCRKCALTRKTHGRTNDKLWSRWQSMIKRCKYPSHTGWDHYGGRGIKVCAQWQQFPAFAEWAEENGWDPKLTLDRKDCDGDYTPENCRWIPMRVNNQNKRAHTFTIETAAQVKAWIQQGFSSTQIAEELNVSVSAVKGIKNNNSWANA